MRDDEIRTGLQGSHGVDDGDFDARFIRRLVTMLDDAGFGHVAFAAMRAGVDVANGRRGREELDALVDLGINLMSRPGRSFAAIRPDDDEER